MVTAAGGGRHWHTDYIQYKGTCAKCPCRGDFLWGALGSPQEAEETTVWLTICELGSIQKLRLGSFREPRD